MSHLACARLFPLVLGIVLGDPIPFGAEVDSVFTTLAYEEAKQEAFEQEQLFIVYASMESYEACRRMNKEAWVDDEVAEWTRDRALVVRLDVEEHPMLALSLRAAAPSAVVMFGRGDIEVARTHGYKSASELLEWLVTAANGEHEADGALRTAESTDVDGRAKLASQLVLRGRYEEALDHYLWLWNEAVEYDPGFSARRTTTLLLGLQTLTLVHAPAYAAFHELLEEQQALIEAERWELVSWRDWEALVYVFGEQRRVVEWFDSTKGDSGLPPVEDFWLESILLKQLVEHQRYADAGRAVADPVARAKRAARPYIDASRMPVDPKQHSNVADYLRQPLAALSAVCLAADREREALGVAEVLLDGFDDPRSRFYLVERASEYAEVLPVHLKWLREAWDMSPGDTKLRNRITRLRNTLQDQGGDD